jgi:hypothetical protein
VQAKGIKNIFNKIIAENFPNLVKEMVIQFIGDFENIRQTSGENLSTSYFN